MKTVLVGALTLLLGLFLGGLAPRAELRRTQKELAEAREAASSAGGGLLPALGLAGLAAARDRAQASARRPVPRFNPSAKAEAAEPPLRNRRAARPGRLAREGASAGGCLAGTARGSGQPRRRPISARPSSGRHSSPRPSCRPSARRPSTAPSRP